MSHAPAPLPGPPPCWVEVRPGAPFGPGVLPYGVFGTADRPGIRRLGVAIGDLVLDAGPAARAVGAPDDLVRLLDAPALNPLLAAGRPAWTAVRARLTEWLGDPAYRAAIEPHLLPVAETEARLPVEVADYVDFYASEHHAANVSRIFRPEAAALTPNWRHLPIGYHGRAGTVVVSGTPVVRPVGQRLAPGAELPAVGPTARLDFEAEVGFVVGGPTPLGEPVPLSRADQHVFGVCLVNDWSARDIQAWEYVPLGPFLGKSFATSVSPWVVPLEALEAARTPPPERRTEPLPYLDDRGAARPAGLALDLEVRINGHLVSRPPFATTYWTYAQMVAHLTVNGASLRAGDLFASGTVSGPEPGTLGSLIELAHGGTRPLALPDGSARAWLEDGDEVLISATAPGPGGGRIGLGEVRGRVLPAHVHAHEAARS